MTTLFTSTPAFFNENIDKDEEAPYPIKTGIPVAQQCFNAMEIINSLKRIGVNGILCGGAPRDWHLGYEVQDLDIYASFASTGMNYTRMERIITQELMEYLGYKYYRTQPRYDGLSMIVDKYHGIHLVVLNYVHKAGQKLQLMLGTKPFDILQQVIPAFSCSICEYYWDYESDKIFTSELNLKQLEKQSVLVNHEERNTAHIEKLKKKFDRFEFRSFPYHSPDRKCTYIEVEKGEILNV